MVEFNHDKIPLYKLIVHCAQIALSVTIWILEIIVFKGGDINGQNGWTFGVVRRTHLHNLQLLKSYIGMIPFADVSPSSLSASFQLQHGSIS